MKPEMPSKMKIARFYANVSQDLLAQMTGIDQARISRIERGYAKPSAEQKRKLAKALKAKVEWLFPKKEIK